MPCNIWGLALWGPGIVCMSVFYLVFFSPISQEDDPERVVERVAEENVLDAAMRAALQARVQEEINKRRDKRWTWPHEGGLKLEGEGSVEASQNGEWNEWVGLWNAMEVTGSNFLYHTSVSNQVAPDALRMVSCGVEAREDAVLGQMWRSVFSEAAETASQQFGQVLRFIVTLKAL